MDSLAKIIQGYLKKKKYNVVPVLSYGINMVMIPDEILCLYIILGNTNDIDKEISKGVDRICQLRDRLIDIIVDTLDDIEITISMYLFTENNHTISSQSQRFLSLKGVELVEFSVPNATLNELFPKYKIGREEIENYEAYTEYMQTVAKYIDGDCAPIANEEKENMTISTHHQTFNYSSPRALADEVKKFVKGQNEVIENVAIPFFQHVESMRNETSCEIKNSFIIIGNTGTGKSEILRRFAQLCDVPIIRINMADCTPSSWKGQHIQDHIGFYLNSEDDLNKLKYAVLVFNEFDKITHYNSIPVSSKGTDWDMDMQREMLRFYDKGYELLIERPTPRGTIETYHLPTDNFLLCYDGAFSGIDKIIEKRIGNANRVGFATLNNNRDLITDISQLKAEDLEKWGYIPELLGRIGSFFVMNPMTEDLMVEILSSASENIIDAHVNQCAQYGIKLKIEKDAIRHIARKAMEMKLGFRAVKSILGDLMKPIYFDCDKYKGKDILVDWNFIKDDHNFKS